MEVLPVYELVYVGRSGGVTRQRFSCSSRSLAIVLPLVFGIGFLVGSHNGWWALKSPTIM